MSKTVLVNQIISQIKANTGPWDEKDPEDAVGWIENEIGSFEQLWRIKYVEAGWEEATSHWDSINTVDDAKVILLDKSNSYLKQLKVYLDKGGTGGNFYELRDDARDPIAKYLSTPQSGGNRRRTRSAHQRRRYY